MYTLLTKTDPAEWARRARQKQRENAAQPQTEQDERRRQEAKARKAGRFKPDVLKTRSERDLPVKLPKAWIEADKRKARKEARAKMPLCKRWFPCCICCHGRNRVEPEGRGKGGAKGRKRRPKPK